MTDDGGQAVMATNDDEQAHDSGQATPLSEARLAEIRERVDATTPGPWELEIGVTHDEFVHYSIRTHDPLPAHPWSPRYIAWLTGGQDSMNGDRPPIKVCDACGMVAYRYRHLQRQVDFRVDEETAADAAFIAHARADIPALLDEVERLRAREAAMLAVVGQVAQPPHGVELVPVFVTPAIYRQARVLLASADESERSGGDGG